MTQAAEKAIRQAQGIRFGLGDKVYPSIGQQVRGVVTGVELLPGHIAYHVTWPDQAERIHYDFEISLEKSVEEA